MELTGQISDIALDYKTDKVKLTLIVNEKKDALSGYDELHKSDKLSIKISRYREKRSLDANDYCWVLCQKLAESLSDERVKHTKEDIYRKAIKETGIYKDFKDLLPNDAATLRHAWEMLGTGWITEQVDFSHDGSKVIVRCYYGSSQYNSKQMSRLIDGLVQDCQSVGIETASPDKIEEMKALWASVPQE